MKKIVITLLAGMALNALPAHAVDPNDPFLQGSRPTGRVIFSSKPPEDSSGVALEMVRIPAGSFTMGCQEGRDKECDSDEKPAHTVNLNSFELGKYEITQGHWKAVMGDNPSYFSNCGETCPVENLRWKDIQTFIQKINAKTGKTYRLPSEAEWEYACRAGGDDEYCGGNNLDVLAWYDGNSGDKTHPVGQKQPNGFGLYDMSGNVLEWVQDCHNSNYNGVPTNGSAWEGDRQHYRVVSGDNGAPTIGSAVWVESPRVLRGGGSWGSVHYSRAALRVNSDTGAGRYRSNGFRLARTLP